MDYYKLFEYSQVRAINAALEPSLDSVWRIKCREYSERFHTPLHVVINDLDPIFVLQHLYEDKYPPGIVDDELEEILEKLETIKDPNYIKIDPQDTEDLVDSVMNKELERFKRKQNKLAKEIKPKDFLKEPSLPEQKPKSGSMNFSSLEELESKLESPKAGFED